MKILIDDGYVTVVREENDPKFYGTLNAAGESRFLYHVQQHLNALGFDFIKKRMWKDGHLVGDLQQYLRTRKAPYLCIYSEYFQICGANEDFNKGKAILKITTL